MQQGLCRGNGLGKEQQTLQRGGRRWQAADGQRHAPCRNLRRTSKSAVEEAMGKVSKMKSSSLTPCEVIIMMVQHKQHMR